MSYDLIVHLQDAKMPTPTAWRDHICLAGFPVELYRDFDPRSMTGFLPAKVNGATSGFEYYYMDTSEEELTEVDFRGKATSSVLFCASNSYPQEIIAALAASSALASMTDGLLVDPQSGERVPSAESISWATSRMKRFAAKNIVE